MLILSHSFFNIEYDIDKIPEFIPTAYIFRLLCLYFCCSLNQVKIHGYIKRIIKHVGGATRVIIIPRIICEVGLQRTHVLLPDFVLPYCNYTCKSLAIVAPHLIPISTALKFEKSYWDNLVSISFKASNAKRVKYVKSRFGNLASRHQSASMYATRILQLRDCKLKYTAKFLKRYYLFAKNSLCLCVLTYIDHMISNINSS